MLSADDTVTAATHVYGNYIDELVESEQWSGPNPPTRYYPLTDDQFSVAALWEARSDGTRSLAQRLSYGDYGSQTVRNPNGTIAAVGTVAALRHGYTGRIHDATTGLTEYRHRWMNPTAGSFLQRDPLGYVDGENLYRYVMNSPMDKRDPHGLFVLCNIVISLSPCGSSGFFCDDTYKKRLSAALTEYTQCVKGLVPPVTYWNALCLVGCVPLLVATPAAYAACVLACGTIGSTAVGLAELAACDSKLAAAESSAKSSYCACLEYQRRHCPGLAEPENPSNGGCP